MEPNVPQPDYRLEYWWDAGKFGLEPEALFTSLYAKYNTFTGAILDPDSFLLDVTEACEKASSKSEFLSCLDERSKDGRPMRPKRPNDSR